MGEFLSAVAGLLSPSWVWGQVSGENAPSFLVWTLLMLALGFAAGWQLERRRRYGLKQFSKRQLEFISECVGAEEDGQGYVLAPIDNPLAEALMRAGVVDCGETPVMGDLFAFNLTPGWRRYLRRHRRGLPPAPHGRRA